MSDAPPCDLCATDGGEVLWRNGKLRVVAVDSAEGKDYRGFCRVVWNTHVREMSDLSDADKSLIMTVVFCVETALQKALSPQKMNLASLGNMTPHVHWHVIPRFANDPTFPNAIWAPQRASLPAPQPEAQPAVAPDAHVIDTLKAHDSAGAWKRAVREALDNL
jgi:diadenosine tetraphosphate (Ap4A) HIT family hydrolase